MSDFNDNGISRKLDMLWRSSTKHIRFLSRYMEYSARNNYGYCTGYTDAYSNMDVRYEPEQHEQLNSDLVHSGSNLRKKVRI